MYETMCTAIVKDIVPINVPNNNRNGSLNEAKALINAAAENSVQRSAITLAVADDRSQYGS